MKTVVATMILSAIIVFLYLLVTKVEIDPECGGCFARRTMPTLQAIIEGKKIQGHPEL